MIYRAERARVKYSRDESFGWGRTEDGGGGGGAATRRQRRSHSQWRRRRRLRGAENLRFPVAD